MTIMTTANDDKYDCGEGVVAEVMMTATTTTTTTTTTTMMIKLYLSTDNREAGRDQESGGAGGR